VICLVFWTDDDENQRALSCSIGWAPSASVSGRVRPDDETSRMAAARTQMPFGEVLAELLHERGLSLRELSRRLGMDATYLSRVRRGHKRVPVDLPRRVAVALGLPEDYFPETREALILDAIHADPELREQIYRTVSRARPKTSPKHQ
jgi:transcriptional regulator with XRE-family HTH domain